MFGLWWVGADKVKLTAILPVISCVTDGDIEVNIQNFVCSYAVLISF
jgi:hypothetical protein